MMSRVWPTGVAFLLVMGVRLAAQPQLQLSTPTSVRGGESFGVDVVASSASGIDAFGFELRFNENLLTYSGLQKGSLTQGFDQLLGNQVGPGLVRIGGYGLTPVGANTGTLCRITFMANRGVEDETILDLRSAVDFPQAPTIEPIRFRITREPLGADGMSAGHSRGLRNKTLQLAVSGYLPTGNSFRGATVRVLFDVAVLEFVSVTLGGQAPGSYTAIPQTPSNGVVDLTLLTAPPPFGGGDLADGELWLVTFRVQPNAPLGVTVISIGAENSHFTEYPSGNEVPVSVTRSGSVTVHPTGDANRSGEVTVADVLTAVLATLASAYADEFTDCNSSNQTTVGDIVCVISALFSQ